MLEVQTYKTRIRKGTLKSYSKRLGFTSVGEMINQAVIGLIEANGLKVQTGKRKPDARQLALPIAVDSPSSVASRRKKKGSNVQASI